MTAVALAACAHCGLPIPAGIDGAFCCTGCEIVAGAIREHGLARYYELREQAAPAHATDRAYTELDDAAFARVHVARDAAGAHAALYLEELSCAACVWLVERTPACIPGVIEVRVDLGRSRADVTWDPAATSLSRIARHLDRIGHAPHPYRGLDRDAQRRREDRALLVKLGVAGAAMGNLMLLAIALYSGLFGAMARRDTQFFRWASMLVALPALAYAATPMFRTALGALRARRLHLDLPLSIGITVGLVWGAANVIRGVGEIYFDSLSMLVFLLLVARWVVLRYRRRASSAAELLLALTPARVHRADGEDAPIEAIVPGDLLEVRAGETMPVDGVIERGASALDQGLLTGESNPVDAGPGDAVAAGTLNLTGPLVVRATGVGEATRVGALVATIEQLASRRAPIERLVDRIASRFVAVVTLAAIVTLFSSGLESAMALLIVTCPCALALATPLAVAVALGRAARRGILIKGADALERMATPGRLFVDKTGTLTEGRLAVVRWSGDLDAKRLAAAVEAGSAHPIARALAALGDGATAADVREELGRGITGRVAGRRVQVGSPAWLAAPAAWVDPIAAAGETPVAIAVDGVVVAIAGLADPIRRDAPAALRRLRAAGWQIHILSGDDPRVVARVAAELGVPGTGGVSPEGKLAIITAARGAGPVAMIGDGVNDAAAIAAATCGIAVSGAAELAIEAADICLHRREIGELAAVVDGARLTMATIRRSLRASLAYNVIAGTLAATGLIHPLLAAVLMPLSSGTVLASSLRSKAFR
ncbi:MAG TPA: heavy metal translocating P-type ATPase [Kofleriaceae bacterium]